MYVCMCIYLTYIYIYVYVYVYAEAYAAEDAADAPRNCESSDVRKLYDFATNIR